MKRYADIHCHMLPGVDDGAIDMETTMQMLEISYQEGARAIVFTPHYEGGNNQYQPAELEENYQMLKEKAAKMWPDLELYLGNELLYEQGIEEYVKDGSVHPMHQTKYVLVEFNVRISYQELYHAMQKMQKIRFRPIIAHVERYHCLTKHPERIAELCEMGVYLQMNMTSVLGNVFNENTRWCRKLLKEKRISFLGTDAHDTRHRSPYTGESMKWLEKHLEAEYLENILWKYPMKMLENKYLEI
ncbi:MAG: protein tyrosine phosphatase [Lachnospiraceae bacterium]|nr:protein tyrosine phosphatase [Lachnospiraceae bacterium]